MHRFLLTLVALAAVSMASDAKAEFIITTAILEFKQDSPRQQDIELVSRSTENDYVVAEVSEIVNPGSPDEIRKLIEDPAEGGLLVTPDKTILTGGSRKVLRFVLLKEPDAKERIYRVAVKPVVKGVENDTKVGLKVLVGYEVLVIVRPSVMQPSYTAQRNGKTFTATNNGNTNVLFQHGQQCSAADKCEPTSVVRVYPGQTAQLELPHDMPVSFSIWNGVETTEKQFP
ncbi:MAG: hypothetical protein FJX23_08105 [Alphaproteobacteria bacterium]|nr:hypothetical protein [Alphaproteobacteria bacterium]